MDGLKAVSYTHLDVYKRQNEIESVTILKDASATAVFGVRGANGVILITTKRGAEGKAKISFTTSAGVNVRTKELEFANSYQYASYVNMMRTNDGNEPLYSDEQLAAFRDHTCLFYTSRCV